MLRFCLRCARIAFSSGTVLLLIISFTLFLSIFGIQIALGVNAGQNTSIAATEKLRKTKGGYYSPWVHELGHGSSWFFDEELENDDVMTFNELKEFIGTDGEVLRHADESIFDGNNYVSLMAIDAKLLEYIAFPSSKRTITEADLISTDEHLKVVSSYHSKGNVINATDASTNNPVTLEVSLEFSNRFMYMDIHSTNLTMSELLKFGQKNVNKMLLCDITEAQKHGVSLLPYKGVFVVINDNVSEERELEIERRIDDLGFYTRFSDLEDNTDDISALTQELGAYLYMFLALSVTNFIMAALLTVAKNNKTYAIMYLCGVPKRYLFIGASTLGLIIGLAVSLLASVVTYFLFPLLPFGSGYVELWKLALISFSTCVLFGGISGLSTIGVLDSSSLNTNLRRE
jgi:hypothetical protein